MQDIRQVIINNVHKEIPLIEIYAGFGDTVDKIEFYKNHVLQIVAKFSKM